MIRLSGFADRVGWVKPVLWIWRVGRIVFASRCHAGRLSPCGYLLYIAFLNVPEVAFHVTIPHALKQGHVFPDLFFVDALFLKAEFVVDDNRLGSFGQYTVGASDR